MGAACRETALFGKAAAVLFMTMLCVSMPLFTVLGHPRGDSPQARFDPPEDGIEVADGIHRISEVASTIIYGEDLAVKGRLGHYSWVGDVNGDGMNDLAVAAPGAPGVGGFEDEGRIYVFYGGEKGLPKVLDLGQTEPDILIISNNTWFKKPDPALPYPVLAYLTNEFDAGDLDGDGRRDLVIAVPGTDVPVWGVIVFGPMGGFPKRMTVHLQKQSVFSEVPGDLRFLWLSSAFLAPGQDNMVLPNYMMVKDLDMDGADELVVGCDGSVRVRWGGSGSWTSIVGGAYDRFGWAIDIGDIDADGRLDLMIGAPLADDPMTGRMDCGAAYVVFDPSQLKGTSSRSISELARPVIYGSSESDMLGRSVMLCDVDGDGKDDLIVAAPEADGGPGITDCGRLYAFKGGENTSFPARIVSDDGAHWTVTGYQGRTVGNNVYPGDRLGTVMGAGDIDGDLRDELVLGIYNRASYLSKPAVVDNVGMIAVFEPEDLFPPGGGKLRLGETDGSFVLEGDSMRDTLGWNLFIGDVTNDGVCDIVVGAPGADGPYDQRTSDGEAYILTGGSATLGPLKVSGKGSRDPYLLAGGHEVMIGVDFVLKREGRTASECSLTIASGGASSHLTLFPTGNVSCEGEPGLVPLEGLCGMDQSGGIGSATFAFAIDWGYLTEGPLDIMFQLKDDRGTLFYRRYHSALNLTKDVTLSGELEVENAEGPLSGIGQWVLPGDVLKLSGVRAVYVKATDVEPPQGSLDLVLCEGGDVIARRPYSSDWAVDLSVPMQQGRDMKVFLDLPLGYGSRPVDMDIGGMRQFKLNIDLDPPLPPEGVKACSMTTGLPEFDRSGSFEVSWNGSVGPRLDPGGSGVKEFQVLSGARWVQTSAKGGLMGTYYRGRSFQEQAFQRVDGELNFTTRDWGPFGPDPYLLRYDDFSVRWHGYLAPTMNGSYLVSLKGSGTLMLKLDGKVVVPRTSIIDGLELTLPSYEAGSLHPLEVHFSNVLPSSFISMEVWDPAYRKLVREEMPFRYPSNRTSSVSLTDPEVGISVRSIDWTGRISAITKARAFKDTNAPLILRHWDRGWFNTTRPSLVSSIIDPMGDDVSGIDLGSIAYSLEREGTARPVWQTVDLRFTVKEQGRYSPKEVYAALDPYLADGWRGELIMTAADMSGNRAITDPVWVGIDAQPPELTLLEPVEGSALYGSDQELIIYFYDGSGSGSDGSSLKFRSASDDGTWSEWVPLEVQRSSRSDVLRAAVSLTIGRAEFQLMGFDIAGNQRVSRTYVLDILEPPVNLPPSPRIAHPSNGTRFYIGQLIELSAIGTWDDGLGPNRELTLTWHSSRDGYLGNGPLVYARLSLGVHEITLFADDGAPGHNVSAAVTIEVIEYGKGASDDDVPPDSDLLDPLSVFALAALLIVVLVLLVFVVLERRSVGRSKDGPDLVDDIGAGPSGPYIGEE